MGMVLGKKVRNGVHTGLGTSIVEALSQQLNAKVRKSAGPKALRCRLNQIERGSEFTPPDRHHAHKAFCCKSQTLFPSCNLLWAGPGHRNAIRETGDAIQRNPLASIGIGLGVGFMLGLVLSGRN